MTCFESLLNVKLDQWLRLPLFLCALIIALALPEASAQVSGTIAGTIVGRVTDANGKFAFDGVRVAVTVNGTKYETTTDQQGSYVLVNIPAGETKAEFTYLGYPAQTLPVTVQAGDKVRLDLSMGAGNTQQGNDQVVQMAELVISSSVVGSARALNDQRAARTLTNIIASDAIGELPDKNMAEAIQRLPGVEIAKDKGEGRFISVRGITTAYVGLSMNGVRMSSTERGTRESAVDVISSSLIGSMEVTKVNTPDTDADDMGGSVNLKTRSGLDHQGRLLRFSGSGTYSHQENLKGGYNTSASFGDTFMDGKLGFVVDVASDYRPFTVYSEPSTGWTLTKSPTDNQNHWIVNSQDFRHYDAKRWRNGASVALDYKFTDTNKVWVRFFDTSYNQKNQQWLTTFPFGAGTIQALTDTSATVSIKAAGIIKSETQIVNNKRFLSAVGGFDSTFGTWTNNAVVGYTAGKYTRPTLTIAYANSAATVVSYAFSGPYDNTVTQVSGPDIGSPSSYVFSTKSAYSNTTSNTHEVTVRDDLRRDFTIGDMPSYFKFGGEYRQKYNNLDGSKWAITASPLVLANSVYPGYDYQYKFGSFPNFQIRQEAVQSFYSNQAAFPTTLTASTTYGGAFMAEEKIGAGYVMGGVTSGKLKVLGGVRAEHTDFEIRGWEVNATTGVIKPVTATNDYTNVMPSAVLTYEFTPRTILRSSWSNTLARPDYNSVAPGRAVDDTKKTVTQGNTSLPALKAVNWDASIEHYYGQLGSVSAAFFYKTIKNFTYSGQSGIDATTGYNLSTFQTAPAAWISGVELTWQQRLTFLPAPFNGFGVQVNGVFGNSEVTYPTRPGEKLKFPGYGHKTGNVALSYSRAGLTLRTAAHFHDTRVQARSVIGADYTQDLMEQKYVQVDFSGSYAFKQHWRVFTTVSNLNNAPLRTFYNGTPGIKRLDTYEAYGWSAEGGVGWNY